jgi:hypothetical protein
MIVPLSGCGNTELQSRQRDRDIVVDGDPVDWEGSLEYIEDAHLAFGLMNDDEDLYIALVVADRAVQRQIMMSGLYVWFDERGEKGKRFGLHFPLGFQERGFDPMTLMRERDTNRSKPDFEEGMDEMMVTAGGKGQLRRVGVSSLDNIVAAAGKKTSALVLEFKVPMARSGQYGYGIGTQPGAVISMCVESPEIEVKAPGEQMPPSGGGGPDGPGGGGVPPGGGPGGRGGGGMPGMGRGGGMGGPRPEMPDPIKIWVTVTLSSENTKILK